MTDFFASEKIVYGQIQLAVIFNRKDKRERVIVGDYDNIVKNLNGGEASLLCDVDQPIGSLLLYYPDDPGGSWNMFAVSQLLDVLEEEKPSKRQAIREIREKTAISFLRDQLQSGEPILVYTAYQIWSGYRALVDQTYEDFFVEAYRNRMARLTTSFMVETKDRYLQLHPYEDFMDPMLRVQKMDMLNQFEGLPRTQVIQGQNVLFLGASITDFLLHYTNSLKTMRIRFKACSNCNEVFAYSHGNQEICSEECKKRQRDRNNYKHSKKISETDFEANLRKARTYWHDRIDLAKKSGRYSEEEIAAMRTKHEAFKADAIAMRKKRKAGEITEKEWSIWIQRQRNLIWKMTSPD